MDEHTRTRVEAAALRRLLETSPAQQATFAAARRNAENTPE